MEIILNNVSRTIPSGCTVGELLQRMNYPRTSAVFVNGRQILFGEYDSYTIKEKDTVRIIRILGGG